MAMNRRDFLRTGGLAASVAAVVAACGNTAGPTSPGRLGVAPPEPTLPTGEVTDIVLLRTAESLHHTAVEAHTQLLDHEGLPAAWVPAIEAIIDNHVAAAEVLDGLITEAGGVGFACANPFWMERYVGPAVEATAESDNIERDLLNIATSLEEIIARSHQALVTAIADISYRSPVLALGLECTRQAAYLAEAAGNRVEPTMVGGEPLEADEDGFYIFYSIPDQLGQVGGVLLTVGDVDPVEATRFSVNLQTPADNSFVYEYLECS